MLPNEMSAIQAAVPRHGTGLERECRRISNHCPGQYSAKQFLGRKRPAPEPFIAIVWLTLLLGGPALVIVAIYRTIRKRGSEYAILFYAMLGLLYFWLAAVMAKA
jgi:hypothetical protein